MSLLSTDIKPLETSFDLLTDRLMPSLSDQLLIMYNTFLQHLSLCYSSCVRSIVGFFYMAGVNIIFSELKNEYFSTRML